MPTRRGRRAGMEEILVVHELDVADIEHDVQREMLAGVFKDADGFALRRGQRGE